MSNKITIGPLQWGIILLTIATAGIHISLLFPDVLFILNGLGYLTLLAALYLPIPALANYRSLIRWVLMGFTALTIISCHSTCQPFSDSSFEQHVLLTAVLHWTFKFLIQTSTVAEERKRSGCNRFEQGFNLSRRMRRL